MSSSGLVAKPPTTAEHSERTRRSLAPRGWAHFALQVVLLGSFTFIYALTGLYGRSEAGKAIGNARDILQLEGTLGIDWEQGLQDSVLRGPHFLLDVANYTYFNCQFSLSILFLIWVYFRRNDRFARVRDALLAANYVSLVVMFVYPLAPPRMLGSFVDTLDENSLNLHSSFINTLNNPYSAMPSLHASYAIVLVSMSLFLVHAVAIGDSISMVSVPLSLIPNVLIAATLARRRLTRATGASNRSELEEVMATQ